MTDLQESSDAASDLVSEAAVSRKSRAQGVISNWWTPRVVVAVVLPLVLYVVLRPEKYGLTPNSSDPIFYTGYAINFDDVLRELGGNRYFVTRWPLYMPSRLFAWAFGPMLGRLMLRWMLSAVLLLCVYHLGKRWKWSRQNEVVVGVVALSLPMFARAFMTDYFEWLVVSFGAILTVQCLEARSTRLRSLTIGALGTCIVITNPVSAAMVGPPAVVYLVAGRRRGSSPILHGVIIFVSALGTLAAGLVWFRVRYGIPNVYQPTIDFIRLYAGVESTHKSPRLEWMEVYLWLYIPIILSVFIVIVALLRPNLRSNRILWAATGLMLLQYAYQWGDQFVRGGLSLEVSYYWTVITPSVMVVLVVLVGAVQWSWRSSAILFASCLAVLALARIWDGNVPGGAFFVVIAVIAVGLASLASAVDLRIGLGLVVTFVLACQVLAPTYDPTEYFRFTDSPRYDLVFFSSDDGKSDRDLAEVVWLTEQLDELDSDSGMFFAPSGPATNVTGVYVPIVTRHLLGSVPEGGLNDVSIGRINVGEVQLLSVLGDPAFVDSTLEQLTEAQPASTILMDETNSKGHHYRLVVLEFVSPSLGFNWEASDLVGRVGSVEGAARVATAGQDVEGWLMHGPNVRLEPGRYRATLEYRSGPEAGPDVGVGEFDVAQAGLRQATKPIVGSSGQLASVSVDFVVDGGDRWEFRVLWGGSVDLASESVTLEPLD